MNPHDILMYGQRQIDELIDRLRPGDWEAIALGTWTTKDLVGHLGAFESRFVEILTVFLGEEPATNLWQQPLDTFNDDQAAVRREWSVEAILGELRDAHAQSMALVPRIPAERWREVGTIPWYGPEYALDDLVVYLMYGHKREHSPQLETVLDRTVARP
ncbi:MAG TPA: DinB family protein [Candidatus Limnocylindrales bacterium]|nr:DinB family protein [Candidatus Limnocylindrales bacterium]